MRRRGWVLSGGTLAVALGCAPIDVDSTVTIHPREAPIQRLGVHQVERDLSAEFVQLGPRVLIQVREHPRCVAATHVPVLRVEQIDRSNRNFVIWDFTLGAAFGGFSALAFARPQLFGDRLIDGQGRIVYDNTAGYTVGGVFAAAAAGLLAAGIVDALRSRDETRYAEAYQVELGPEGPCPTAEADGSAVAERPVVLRLGELELEGTTDGEGRVRFELPASVAAQVAGDGSLTAVLIVGAPSSGASGASGTSGTGEAARYLSLPLRDPRVEQVDAHTGVADTRAPAAAGEPGPRVLEVPTP